MRRIVFAMFSLYAATTLAWLPLDSNNKIPGTNSFEEEYELKPWQELATSLPPAPKPENLQSIAVSAASPHKFFVDLESLSVGADGVVRYTLVVQALGGAKNTSYEGMRCVTREYRVYALGQADASWSKARTNLWSAIKDGSANRQHAALFLDFFCPSGMPVGNVDAARRLLRQGGGTGDVRVLGR